MTAEDFRFRGGAHAIERVAILFFVLFLVGLIFVVVAVDSKAHLSISGRCMNAMR